MNKPGVIFDLTNPNYKYKGVLFAEVDCEEIDNQMKSPFPFIGDYIAGIMAIIWVDNKNIWHSTLRIKFPSGNKQVVTMDFDEEEKEGICVNETFVLQKLYTFPMINKKWYRNEDETPEGIVKILQNANMIESLKLFHRINNE